MFAHAWIAALINNLILTLSTTYNARHGNTFRPTRKIRPHRLGGEGVLIRAHSVIINAQITFVIICLYLAGGGDQTCGTELRIRLCFAHLLHDFWVFGIKVAKSLFLPVAGERGKKSEKTLQIAMCSRLWAY